MTGYQSKKTAALDEDGMYLVHHTKRKDDDDDDTQVYKRPWVGLTEDDLVQIGVATGLERAAVEMISNKLKEKNT